MEETSKLIMGATLVMVVSLAIVLGLILVLLAELYCSLLLHRRQKLRKKTNTIPISTTQSQIPNAPPPFSNVYSQGVLQAPRTFLFPSKDESSSTPRAVGLVSFPSSSPLASFLARAPPHSLQQHSAANNNNVEHLVYISNPIYDGKTSGSNNTTFDTPDTSPSLLLESSADGDVDVHSPPSLTPMKKLPAAEASGSSVSLRDATSLGTSASDSHSINGPSSSSTSATPCTSPSW